MESQQSLQQKINQTVNKNASILQQGKYYQFAQKIKLLAHRKMQMNKFQQSQLLLQLGAQKLFQRQPVQNNIPIELINQLSELLCEHPQLWDQRSQKRFYLITSIRKQNADIIKIYQKICKKICDQKQCVPFAGAIVQYYQNEGKFIQVQNYAVLLSYPRGLLFLKKWSMKLQTQQQKSSIFCRFALVKALSGFQDQSQKYIAQSKDSPYKNFSRFLLKCIQIKSKKGYQKLGDEYKFLLLKDQSYMKLYEAFGSAHFGLVSKKKATMPGFLNIMG